MPRNGGVLSVEDTVDNHGNRGASFDNLNNDCIIHIVSYLPAEDMNSVAICSRSCRDARNTESLDQTRSGTIVLTDNSSLRSINNAITNGGWNTIFSGNRTRLKITGFERVPLIGIDGDIAQLTGVTSLDLSLPAELYSSFVCKLIQMCPNVADIDLSHVKVFPVGVYDVWNASSNSIRVTWKGCRGLFISGGFYESGLFISGGFYESRHTGTEVNLSDTVFRSGYPQNIAMRVYGAHNSEAHMLSLCPALRRLDIKNASWHCIYMHESADLPQEIIIKMVRHHQDLVWLRSDLTNENVAMLKQERPEMHVCLGVRRSYSSSY